MKLFDYERRETAGFTFVELLIILTIVAVFVGLLLPALVANGHRKSSSIHCVNNLKNVGLAFRIFATDRGERFPVALSEGGKGAVEATPATEVFRYFQARSNELGTPKILICPADDRGPATNMASLRNENISYFLGLDAVETKPESLLAGDRNLTLNGSPVSNRIISVTRNTELGWSKALHNQRGNVALGDGSVQQWVGATITNRFGRSGNTPHRIAVP